MSARRSGAFFRPGARGPSTLNGKRGTWWVSFTVQGHHIRKPTNALTKSEALKIRSAYLADAERGELRLQKRRGVVLLDSLCAGYLEEVKAAGKRSWSHDERHLASIVEYFGPHKAIATITQGDVLAFRTWRASQRVRRPWGEGEETVRPATANRTLSVLRSLLFHAVDHGHLEQSPFPAPRRGKRTLFAEENQQDRVITPEEEARILAAAEEGKARHLADMFALCLHTGMRRGEMFALEWGWIDFIRRKVSLPASVCKGKKPREVRLDSTAVALLVRLRASAMDAGLVFRTPAGTQYRSIQTAWVATLKRAGVARTRFHATRHTWATRCGEAGMHPIALMKLGGWSSLEMVLRYCHPSEELELAALERACAVSPLASHKYGTRDEIAGYPMLEKTAISA